MVKGLGPFLARLAVVGLILLIALPAWAASVQLRMGTRDLRVGESLLFSVAVTNGQATAVPRVDLADGLRLSYERQETDSHTVVANGRISVRNTLSYVYKLTALAEGEYTIGPVEIEVVEPDGSTSKLKTGSAKIRVQPRPEDADEAFRVEAGFDTDSAWEGQVVVYRYALMRRVRVLRAGWSLPEFDGLVPPREANQPRNEQTIEDDTGAYVLDESWLPFVVTGRGALDQPPAVLRADLPTERGPRSNFAGLFTNTRTEVFATEPAKLQARSLPDAPDDFTGLVGDFVFRSTLDKPKVAVGESVTWTVNVRGDGTLEGFSLPMPEQIDGAQLYDNGPSVRGGVIDGQYLADGNFVRVVVPTKPGTLALPNLPVTYFSPSQGRYVTAEVEMGTIEVTPGNETAAEVESFMAVEAAGPTVHVAEDIRRPWTSGGDTTPWLGGLMRVILPLSAMPGLALLAVAARERTLAWMEARRAAESPPPSAQLRNLPDDPEARLAAMDAAFQEAVAHAGIVDEALADEVEELRRVMNRARFAGDVRPDLEDALADLVGRLEAR